VGFGGGKTSTIAPLATTFLRKRHTRRRGTAYESRPRIGRLSGRGAAGQPWAREPTSWTSSPWGVDLAGVEVMTKAGDLSPKHSDILPKPKKRFCVANAASRQSCHAPRPWVRVRATPSSRHTPWRPPRIAATGGVAGGSGVSRLGRYPCTSRSVLGRVRQVPWHGHSSRNANAK
jgi:hypothetical protein